VNARTDLLGLFPGLPAETYHRSPGVSNSMLSALKRSPMHCWALHLNPDRPEREETASMFTGTLAHCSVLEADAMAARYVVVPDDAPRRPTAAQWKAKSPSIESKAAMAWWSHFNEHTTGRLIVTAEQYDTTRRQLAAVLAVPELANALASGMAEASLFWVDERTGLQCRCRPDWIHRLPDGRVIVVDLKTTADADPQAFGKSVWNYGYHRQAAYYTAGLQACGIEVAAFIFAAVTSAYPFIAVPYLLDDEATRRGADEVRDLLDLYQQCSATNTWPAYGSGVQVLSLPAWAK